MTPGIPLLVGWTCTAFLFAGQPAKYLPRSAAVMLGALVLAVLCGVALDRSWQLLAAALLMMGAAALVSMSLVQEFAPLSAAVGALEPGRAGAGTSRAQVIAWLLGVALVYAATSYLLPHLLGGVDMLARLEGTDSRACISRKVLWSNVLQLIAQKPWWGWGWGELDYAHYYANYSGMRFCSLLDHAHNLPLQLAVELGIPLALALCGLCLWWVLRNRPWAETNPARQLMWGVLVVMAVHSMVEYPLWYAHFQLACGLALGVLWSTARSRRASAVYTGATARYLQGALAGCLLLGMAYASFDFARVTQLYMAVEDRIWPFRNETREQAERSLLYRNAVQFASVSLDPVTLEQAEQQLAIARRLMHYSPESRMVIRIIECLRVLERHAEADAEAEHFKQVYPAEYARWHADAEK